MNAKHRQEFEKAERAPVTEDDFMDALNILLKPKTDVKFKNREPAKQALDERFKLVRDH